MLGICTALSHLRRSTHPLQSTMALMDEISARLHRQDDASFNDEVSPLSSAQPTSPCSRALFLCVGCSSSDDSDSLELQ